MKERLYSPAFVSVASSDDSHYNPDYQCRYLNDEETLKYFDTIKKEMDIQRINSIPKNGFMKFFDGSQSIKEKVSTGFPNIEVRNGKIYMVMELDTTAPLTSGEMEEIKNFLACSYSDGDWQQFIPLKNHTANEKELRVEFNHFDYDELPIFTEKEMMEYLSQEQNSNPINGMTQQM